MKKKFYTFVFLSTACILNAQVGINTTTPNSQLDIRSSNQAAPSNNDGILIPKVDVFPATNPTAVQQGMLVYLNTISGIDLPGFYYWDNATVDWKPIAGTSVGTLDQAYDFGGAGFGKTITADAGAVLINGTDGLISTGTIGSGAILPNVTGARMIWYPRKAAFRAGITDSTQWDEANIGDRSIAFGRNTTASGENSTAFGINTTSIGISTTAFGNTTVAAGFGSTAFGDNTLAFGDNSTAFGNITSASGTNSTTFGAFNIASGFNSTAFGANSTASGNESLSLGSSTTASGLTSIATGLLTTAIGTSSVTFGRETTANGSYSSSFGRSNTAQSYCETVLGIGATTYTLSPIGNESFAPFNSTDRLFVIGNAIDENSNLIVEPAERSDAMIVLKNGLTRLPSTTNTMITDADGKAVVTKEYLQSNTSGTLDQAYDFGGAGNGRTITADAGAVLINGTDGFYSTGIFTIGATLPISGAGVKMLWYPRKAAFRVGKVDDTQWDDVNIGFNSTAFGTNSTAFGTNSTAFGFLTTASETNSTAFGTGSIANGNNSTAFGRDTNASGSDSTAFGRGTNASGSDSTAFGRGTNASGSDSTAFGENTTASGSNSTAFGVGSTASNSNSTAFGNNSIASGFSSTAFGNLTTASGEFATSFGRHTTASGSRSTVFGNQNTASSYGETVIGIGATTYLPTINGAIQFRTANATDRLFVIGNAVDTNNNGGVDAAERSNAMVVLKNGNIGIGTSTPARTFHIATGVSGATPFVNSNVIFESNGDAYQQFLTPNTLAATGSGLLFGTPAGSIRGGVVFAALAESLDFRTGGNNQRMLITNAGDVGIGAVTPGGQFELSLNEGRKPGTNTWTVVSDSRLKTINGIYTKGLSEILQLNPIRYNYKNAGERIFEKEVLDTEFPGFIAQEVQRFFPDAVGTDADGFLNFNIHPILIASVNAIKELNAKNESLQTENNYLKSELNQQKAVLESVLKRLEQLEQK